LKIDFRAVRGAWVEMILKSSPAANMLSLPVRGAWVEIFCCYDENGADAPDFRRKNALAEASGAAGFAPSRP
jgi:hypothetical protein